MLNVISITNDTNDQYLLDNDIEAVFDPRKKRNF